MVKRKSKTVMDYNVVFQEEAEGGYSVWVPDLPGCASQGESVDEALVNIRQAIELYLEDKDVNKDDLVDYKKQFVMPVRIYA